MRLADLRAPAELLQATCDDARLVIERDPDPQSERSAARPPLPLPVRRCGEDAAGGITFMPDGGPPGPLSAKTKLMLLSPLGERLGEGVMQETVFGYPPHLTSPPRGRGT